MSHGILNSAPGWSLKAKDPTPPQQLKRCCPLINVKDTNLRSPIMIYMRGEYEETGVDRVMTIFSWIDAPNLDLSEEEGMDEESMCT